MRDDMGREQATGIYADLAPSLAAYRGFRGSSLLVNDSTRMAVALIYWETEEDASRAGETLRPLLYECTCDLTDAALDITGYRVLQHSMVGS
jgi:hypothetical protein